MALLLIVLNIPVALFVAGFLPMLADVIPIEQRARVFAARNTLLGATVMIGTIVLGWWLNRATFPLNYQLVYALGVVASTISTLYVARVAVPDSPVLPPEPRAPLRDLRVRELLGQQRPFVNIVLNTLIFNLPFWMATPLQPIYFVRVLGASDAWLGLWLGVISGGTIVGNQIWRRAIDRRGPGWVLARSTVLSAAYYFLIGAFPDLDLILVFALIAGLVNPGVEISHLNTLLELCPIERRATYIGVFVTVMNIGFFLAPLAVAPLTDAIGARELVLGLGALRLAGALLFTINPVRIPAAEPATIA
jgi:Na+/melibiose symporter-like transporter